MTTRILYAKPSITDLEVDYAADAARHGWGSQCYRYIEKFEQTFKTYIGAKHAIATSSCTGALHMGLAALGVGVGDEVILADTNWVASVAPVTYLGATPVLIDILPDTWCLDPAGVEAAITPRTKAIIATHLYGNLCEMQALLAMGKKYGVPVIEDAAEAIGSRYRGAPAGSMGACGVFSFHGTKTVTTGEGGMFVTNSDAIYEKCLALSNHGRTKEQLKQFWPDMVGYKYKMSNLQAAVGCAQMERVDELVSRKREIFAYYKARLDLLAGVQINPEKPGTINSYWMPTLVFDAALGITRELLLRSFGAANIDARVFFWPLSALDMFEEKKQNHHAWDIAGRAINLPSYHDLTENDLNRVCLVVEKLTDGFEGNRVGQKN